MGKRSEKKSEKKKFSLKSLVLNLLEIACVFTMLYSGAKIVIWARENNASKKQMEELSKAVVISDEIDIETGEPAFEVDFNYLKESNSQTVGYLKLNGLDIEFPVVQADDNDFYLTHSFDKSYNSAGWIFADFRNKVDGTDKNLVIYGHNRRDGSMFCPLRSVLTEEWFSVDKNKKFMFITENGKSYYQIFSVYKIPAEDYYITTDFYNNEFQQFLNVVKDRSEFDFGVDVNYNDTLITLSTCDNNSEYRIAVHAKKIIDEAELKDIDTLFKEEEQEEATIEE